MIVCVSGATGFIGRKLAEQYLRLGNEVRYLTRTDSTPIIGAKAIVGDLNAPIDQLMLLLSNADTFYHCAGELKNEALMYSTHVQGTINLLNAIEESHTQNQNDFHWVQLSSCGAYGQLSSDSSITRDVDEDTQENPNGMYECTKTEADHLIVDFSKKHDWFKYTIIRPTIVFGVGMRGSLIIRIASMIKKRFFFYIGHKNAIANFVHVDDVINAMILSAKQPNAYNQTFVVSNDCKFSNVVDTLADTLLVPKPRWVFNDFLLRKFVDLAGKWIKLPINNTQVDVLMRQTHYSNNKIRKMLDWSPSDSILMQLKQYINAVFNVNNG
jgi:nucleoside-diphosphate-sugar epimerase